MKMHGAANPSHADPSSAPTQSDAELLRLCEEAPTIDKVLTWGSFKQGGGEFYFAARTALPRLIAEKEELRARLIALSEGGCHDAVGDEYGNFPCPYKPRAEAQLAAPSGVPEQQVSDKAVDIAYKAYVGMATRRGSDHLDCMRAALETFPAMAAAISVVEAELPPLTDEIISDACSATHWGKKSGVWIAVHGTDYPWEKFMRKIWKGVNRGIRKRAALRAKADGGGL